MVLFAPFATPVPPMAGVMVGRSATPSALNPGAEVVPFPTNTVFAAPRATAVCA